MKISGLLRNLLIAACLCPAAACSVSNESGDKEMDRFVSDLMDRMTVREKLGQLNLPTGGDLVTGTVMESDLGEMIRNQEIGGFLNVKGADKIRELQRIATEETSLKIPLLAGADIIHGYETVFPIPLAMSCSWDPDAVEKMARISAIEASAAGINWTYSPMLDICRDARWGRIAEGNGEDPYLGSVLAKAYIRGYQGEKMSRNDEILACVKHFALYGASEAGRDYNTVDMSRYRMFNGYLPPYRAAIEAGAGSVMSSFNLVDGIPATANKWLLTDLLRDKWGFKGMVVTDYNSIGEMDSFGIAPIKEASEKALAAGTDMDMVSGGFLNYLEQSLKEGKVTMEQIDAACRRILETKYRLGLFEDPYKYCNPEREASEIFTPEHRNAAREIAAETFVLLKNQGNVLPLKPKGRIALVGPLADAANNMCGMWASTCRPENHSSLLEGMRKALSGKAEVLYAKGSNIYGDPETERNATGYKFVYGNNRKLLDEAIDVASKADVIVAALGEGADMSGESASRADLTLPDVQHELLKAMLDTGKPVVLVLFTGRPVVLSWEDSNVPAILNVWFAGSEAADAIPDVLLGKVSPSGKLTATFPRSVGQIPIYYNHLQSSRPDNEDYSFQRFASNYIDSRTSPLYPFGYGLSYTTFEYGKPELSSDILPAGGTLTVSLDITNTGNFDSHEIVQLYIRDRYSEIARPVKELKGFRRVFIKKGETVHVTFTLTGEDLKYYDSDMNLSYEPGEFDVMIGANSRDVQTLTFTAE